MGCASTGASALSRSLPRNLLGIVLRDLAAQPHRVNLPRSRTAWGVVGSYMAERGGSIQTVPPVDRTCAFASLGSRRLAPCTPTRHLARRLNPGPKHCRSRLTSSSSILSPRSALPSGDRRSTDSTIQFPLRLSLRSQPYQNLAIGRDQLHLLATVLVLLLSALAAAFCSFWIAQIKDAKQLNNAKFRVLNDMAPRLIFDSSGSASPSRSFKPFEREWEFLQSEDALTQTTSRQGRLIVLRGSSAEYFVPKSFRLVFVGTFLAAAVLLCVNFNAFVDTAHLRQQSTVPTSGVSPRPTPPPRAPKDHRPSVSPSLTSQP